MMNILNGFIEFSWFWSSLIGIFGVILCTFLGWFLNKLSLKGKLEIYFINLREKFSHLSSTGFSVDSRNYDEAEMYRCDLSLDINNTSGKQKIMRNVTM